ncbi:MAG: APC family permease [Candidatus Aminicenantes bacterium]|nr:APC family permease [Candidatus Aminicenantes bacterium]
MNEEKDLKDKIRETLIGKPKNIKDPHLFHKLALIPILAWIGLGADGLSSSSYGPEEAFKALGQHTYLALFLALATTVTVIVISAGYARIIEYFPSGGGGYLVASRTLGEKAGVVSGAALFVDYILTITVSIVSCGDAVFSFFPLAWQAYKVPFEILLLLLLVVFNLRGVKESVKALAPIFLVFVITHLLLIGYGILSHIPQVGPVSRQIGSDFKSGLAMLGAGGMLLLFFKAFSLGGGTYTGIEAVSNSLQILREPRANTGKKTMVYMAVSLAFTASGILVCYLLLNVKPVEGRTLNAILAGEVFSGWGIGKTLAFITIFSEGAILFVAAQAGFVAGPRVMANMAVDYWFPHRFASLSDRLTIHNGVFLMGGSAVLLLLYARGNITTLVVMYSINVFLTFSLSQLGMSRFFIKNRATEPKWKRRLPIHLLGLALCLTILVITTVEKFALGGWLTLVITSVVVALCFLTKRHYNKVREGVRELDDLLLNIPTRDIETEEPLDPRHMTAIQLVNGYNGFGVHTLLSVIRSFPGLYKNFIFVSVAEVDVGSFRETADVCALERSVGGALQKYVSLARRMGLPAGSRFDLGTDIVETAGRLIEKIVREYPHATVFAGQSVFPQSGFIHRIMHNETAFAIQRELRWKGITTVILPIRINI